MIKTVEEELEDVMYQINDAKRKGKSFIKIKVYQTEMKFSKKCGFEIPTNSYLKTGMVKDGKGEKILIGDGYKISYEYQTRDNVKQTFDGPVKVSTLKTTVMVIRW